MTEDMTEFRPGLGLRLEFAEPVDGPVLLGSSAASATASSFRIRHGNRRYAGAGLADALFASWRTHTAPKSRNPAAGRESAQDA
jgi:hypothetical protein